MLTLLLVYVLISFAVFLLTVLIDVTDKYTGAKAWYKQRRIERQSLQIIEKFSPLKPWRWLLRIILTYKRTSIAVGCIVLFHVFLHLANPYAGVNYFQSPYTTEVSPNGAITYQQQYKLRVLHDDASDLLGYYRSGFLIAQNTLLGGKPIVSNSEHAIISEIHKRRFDPSKPYLISGDQFSVLYPRNLGVFYNQLLDPNTAHSKADWEHRQRIYLQSVLFAIDGLSAGDVPKTTLIPIAPQVIVTTRVHPGDVGSDAVYGTLYAINTLATPATSTDGQYRIQTTEATKQLLRERQPQLKHMVESYVSTVQDPSTKLVRSSIHLSSARDGASRSSSFYDNIVLWKTMALADKLGISSYPANELDDLRASIKSRYWNEQMGYYNNDANDTSFSSDWLIGYVSGFFSLSDTEDIERTKRTVAYIQRSKLADPLPIKYQLGRPKDMPWVIKTFVPNYGGDAIWSYWGAEYMTLLINLTRVTGDQSYSTTARTYRERYDEVIVRDGGFAETFNAEGQFLQTGIYKSIRITGWVVQYEHATRLLDTR